jgi:AbrB family looped-hinge helix DNA binding protein
MQNEESKAPADTVKGRYMGSVKVGTKGQIVIPKEARDIFNIKPGDTLLLLADIERGIAIHGLDFFNKMADEIFSGKHKPAENEKDEGPLQFANEIKKVGQAKEKEK